MKNLVQTGFPRNICGNYFFERRSYLFHIPIIFLAIARVLNFLTTLLLEALRTAILSPDFLSLYGI